ncbi:MAG: nicotinamide mononucleotide transporter family protein [Acidimicrobiales bacterium]
MNLFGLDIPTWVLDWSGSVLVVSSLVYLFGKQIGYWHFSNASLLPYFALFVSGRQFMLAGLQASYLVFGIHGLLLWRLEHRRDTGGDRFNERVWYQLGWILSLGIFAYTIAITDFVDQWAWIQFIIVSLSLLANWATTRKWTWSWPVWLVVNVLQAVFFRHVALWGQFVLQFVLFAMSIRGWVLWQRDDRRRRKVTYAYA